MAQRVARLRLSPGSPHWCPGCLSTSRVHLYLIPERFDPERVQWAATVCLRCREENP